MPAKVPARQKLCDAIIKSLENGTSPWQKEWDPQDLVVRNGVSGRAYTGMFNILTLLGSAAERGMSDPRWVTFNQASQKKWKVIKDSKAVPVYYWKMIPVATEPSEGDENAARFVPVLKYFNVHNLSEVEGAPPLSDMVKREFQPILAGEALLKASPVKVEHAMDTQTPCYRQSTDTIYMPLKEQFHSPMAYYAALGHEIAHATGHPSRTDRFAKVNDKVGVDAPLNQKRAYEELVAEMASLYISAETGLPYIIENHADYIGEWISLLKNSPSLLLKASKDASDAADFVLVGCGIRQAPAEMPIDTSATTVVPDSFTFD